jgi:hypothetical protein
LIQTVNDEIRDVLRYLHGAQADVDQLQTDLDNASERRDEAARQLAYWQRVQKAIVKLDEAEGMLAVVPDEGTG